MTRRAKMGNRCDIDKLFQAARKHLGKGTMESSARLCMEDAVNSRTRGDLENARYWAMRSIAYSVGIFHNDYRRFDI